MTMRMVIAENELYNACRVLFGAEMHISRSFLEYIQPSGIKTAYRKKALETHPDMLTGKSEDSKKRSADLFQMAQQAYESLLFYLDAREKGFKFHTTTPTHFRRPAPKPANRNTRKSPQRQQQQYASQRATASQSARRKQQEQAKKTPHYGRQHNYNFHKIPSRKLLFGHYLFYSGVTNWQTIVKALVWQRNRRPKLGEIGRRFGWLNNQDILAILKHRKLSRSFGESAVGMGMITEAQLRLMVFQQQRLQKKFGEYYIHNNILSKTQLNNLIHHFRQHNLNISAHRRQARFHS